VSSIDDFRIDEEESEDEDEDCEDDPEVNVDEDDRVMKLFGRVNCEMSFAIWMALDHLSSQSEDEITLVLRSMGGNAHDMFAIVDAMELCPCPIRTVGTGLIASAATLIVSAGTPGRRFLTNNCVVMAHDLQWGYPAGLNELNTITAAGNKIETRYHHLMAKYGNKPVGEIRPYLIGHGNWMFARDAIAKLGIADKILTKSKW
jgi:ATP-dependent Clp protease protease subunit